MKKDVGRTDGDNKGVASSNGSSNRPSCAAEVIVAVFFNAMIRHGTEVEVSCFSKGQCGLHVVRIRRVEFNVVLGGLLYGEDIEVRSGSIGIWKTIWPGDGARVRGDDVLCPRDVRWGCLC